MENKIHIINTVFTGRGTPRMGEDGRVVEESEEWIQKRIYIFKKYTLASLRNQTNKNFLHWICFRNHHPAWDKLGEYLKSINYNFVFTFSGQCHWDDRASNKTLEQKNINSLVVLEPYLKGKKWVYYTLLDSDDMFTKDAVELIQQQEPEEGKSLIFQKGYAINYFTKEIADWFCVSPPFYTIIYPGEVFSDAKEKMAYEVGLNSHEDAINIYKSTIMPEDKYCYLIHDTNKSTEWEHAFRGKIYTDREFRKEKFNDLGL